MTHHQVIILIICASVAGLVFSAYWLGWQAGKTLGRSASDIQHKVSIQRLETTIGTWRLEYENLHTRTEQLYQSTLLHEKHRDTLLGIAETLRIAAETWKAFKTGKKLERDARRQRDEVLALAQALAPATQGVAA